MTTEELLMEVVRMLNEREEYFDAEYKSIWNCGDFRAASVMLGKSCAYNSARQMLMAALTGDVEMLREFDYFSKGDK